MSDRLSANTQAILLLTAPLLTGRAQPSERPLTPTEYRRLARQLHEAGHSPEDLLSADAHSILDGLGLGPSLERFERLLARGFQLSQAFERWSSRAIWVVSRADADYPLRFKQRLRDDAPPIVYGCGDRAALDDGGLAVVGSRRANDALIDYTMEVGRLAARARCTVVSGGARGVDRAAMSGALELGGRAIGVLADGLEKAAMSRENRASLMQGRLLLLCACDPSAGFNVGNAMQRNKLIYALADFALVVNADYGKGGTWAGAVEQLEKRHFVPVYVRSLGGDSEGINGLRRKGAAVWPEPSTVEGFEDLLEMGRRQPLVQPHHQEDLFASAAAAPQPLGVPSAPSSTPSIDSGCGDMSEELFSKVRELLTQLEHPKSDTEIAAELGVSTPQARQWLLRLIDEGLFMKYTEPVRYGPTTQQSPLD